MGKRLAKKVLVIGWDAADWKVINPLIDEGKMPALEKLINRGVMGNFATLEPPFSPMLWTSIATGVRADKHGILGFTEPSPDGSGVRPVSCTSRKVKAIWNILTQHDLKTNVIGWWPSHPAEPVNGVTVSNLYQRANNALNEGWPMLPGTVHPPELEDTFATLRIHPDELTQAHIQPFVPHCAEVDQDRDSRLGGLSKIIADAASIHSAATWTMENTEWDFMGVYYDAIDHFGHGFMKFHPPQMNGVPDDIFRMYKDVVNAGYLYHDMILDRLITLAGEDTTIMLISDHGFHSDHLRPGTLPKEPAAPALEHNPFGIVVMAGPNIKKDERIYGATLLDVTPTILTLFGLPVGEDMEGHSLVQAFEDEVTVDSIPSWENIKGEDGMHPKDLATDEETSKEVMQQLIDLGYIEDPGPNVQISIDRTAKELEFNLARVFIGARKYVEAIPILEKLYKAEPDESRFALRLATCYQQCFRMEECREVITDLRDLQAKKKQEKEDKKVEIEAKAVEMRKKREEEIDRLKAEGKDPEKELKKKKVRGRKRQQGRSDMVEGAGMPSVDFLEGSLLLGESKPKEALKFFLLALDGNPRSTKINLQVARCHMQLKSWDEAQKSLKFALTIDPDLSEAFHSLSICHLRKKEYSEAIENALNAVGLIYHFPFAHYHLGEALYHYGEVERASEAFNVCLSMAPNVGKARTWLIKIYEELGEQVKADKQKEILQELSKGNLTIVSGLPRSGTSMMMQMLEKGGHEMFVDGERSADESNPKGYLEHEAVKRLARDATWLEDVGEGAVKIISHLLRNLPVKYNYKIVFMLRDVEEVVTSQNEMLKRDGKSKGDAYPMNIDLAFRKNLENIETWVKKNQNIDILYVNHIDVLADPLANAKKVNAFLGKTMDVKEMASVVDKSLHRSKSRSKGAEEVS
ncbi:MAG: alkaline phosphatase family protein [Flavobacteriales bacterium]|nr:alkaline phosphatase family protein [Flavobacteriales bacterium]